MSAQASLYCFIRAGVKRGSEAVTQWDVTKTETYVGKKSVSPRFSGTAPPSNETVTGKSLANEGK